MREREREGEGVLVNATTCVLTRGEKHIFADRSTLHRLGFHESHTLSDPCSLLPSEGPHKDLLQH